MHKIISQCPVCQNRLKVVKLQCDQCETVIENDFALSRFDYLSPEELKFAETFIKCRGNIKEVEKDLQISYPTVRAKLDGIIKSLGLESTENKERAQARQSILEKLEKGELTAEEAIEQLK